MRSATIDTKRATLRSDEPRDLRPPGSPATVWAAFAAQGRWKSWTLVGLLATQALSGFALIRLSSRPPEYILVDAEGNATPVRRAVATDALLAFLAEKTRPPEPVVVRFTRDFMRLGIGLNSSTIDANWPAALAMMSPELRARVDAEAATRKLVEVFRSARRKTEIAFHEIVVEDRTPSQLTVRVVATRKVSSLVDGTAGSSTERIQVSLVERFVPPTMERPDGLEVSDWRVTPLPGLAEVSLPGRQ